jgi:hypothetical protein
LSPPAPLAGPAELSAECPQEDAALGVAQLGAAATVVGAGSAAAAFDAERLAATFFFAELLLEPAFLADFFGAAALDFLADLLPDFLALLAVFFADLFDDLDDFFADFFLAVTRFFLVFLAFLPLFFFLPLAIVILLLPPTNVYRAFQSSASARVADHHFNLAGDRLLPNQEAQSCAQQELTCRRQFAPCNQYCPRQSCPA